MKPYTKEPFWRFRDHVLFKRKQHNKVYKLRLKAACQSFKSALRRKFRNELKEAKELYNDSKEIL